MKHHYVPQFLLRTWSDKTPDKLVETFRLDLPNIPSSRHAPRFTAFEDDLYALTKDKVAGIEKQAIERRFLRLVDDQAARVREKLDTHGLRSLTADERVQWARFLMSLRVRQPHWVSLLKARASIELRESLADQPEQYEELAGDDDPPSMLEWTEKHYPGLVDNVGMSIFHKLVDNPSIGTKIMHMRWWLWDFSDSRHELLLADQPCILTHGIDDPSLIIALPIGPRKAFMATNGDQVAAALRRHEPKDVVVRLNESSLNQARTRIYASNDSPRRFIENHSNKIRAARQSGQEM